MQKKLLVIKRDGREVDFDKTKIEEAIKKAFKATGYDLHSGNTILDVIDNIADKIKTNIVRVYEKITVEDIQDLVEHELMGSKFTDVAKSYILYRNERTKVRDKKGELVQKVMDRVTSTVDNRSNANVDEKSFSGREKEASADIGKMIALDYGGLSQEVADAHKNMLIYQHDLEKAIYGVHNCLNLNFQEIFTYGFRTRNGDVRPPTSFSTACQLVAVAFQCQSQVQFGGVGTIHLDYDLAPFVRKSFLKHFVLAIVKTTGDFIDLDFGKMKTEEIDDWVAKNKHKYFAQANVNEEDICIDNKIKLDPYLYQSALFDLFNEGRQAAQGLYHNLNTLESRQGSQVPFTSINVGRDTSTEGRLVTKWIMEASLDGIGKHHLTSIFPISIFQYKAGTNANKGDKNYDMKRLALESMSKRIYPNWCNCDWSQAHEDEDNIDTYFSTINKTVA